MRQRLSELDHTPDDFGVVGEDRYDEASPPRDRRLPMLLLSVLAMGVFAGGLWFAYIQGARHASTSPAQSTGGDGIPVIRADSRPDKVKPENPGGMTVPDQNVSLYDKPGGSQVEKLLPGPEQPLPRPVAPPPAPVIPPQPAPGAAAPAGPAPAMPAAAPAPTGPAAVAKAAAKPPAQPKAAPAETAAAPVAKTGPVQIRLASVRTPEAARDEWTRLKRDNADILGKLTANAVKVDLGGDKGVFYRIQAGPVADTAAAQRLCVEMKRRDLGCILVR